MTFLVNSYAFGSTAGVLIDGYTKLRQTSAQSIAAGSSYVTVTWGAEDHDNLAAFNSGSSTSNIVVPSGITLMRAQVKGAWGNVAGTGNSRHVRLWDATNSIAFLGTNRSTPNEAGFALDAGWLTVTPGSTLVLQAYHGDAGARDFGNASFGGLIEMTLGWASDFSVLHG